MATNETTIATNIKNLRASVRFISLTRAQYWKGSSKNRELVAEVVHYPQKNVLAGFCL